MTGQPRRGPGRPRTGRGTRAVTLTLSNEVTEYLDGLPAGERSRFADKAMKREIAQETAEKAKFHGRTTKEIQAIQREEQGNGEVHA